MESLPFFISAIFGLTTIFTVILFAISAYNSKTIIIILSSWLILQFLISLTGFYQNTSTNPPRFLLLVLPPILFIIGLFTTKKGKYFIDRLNPKTLTLLHIVRVPVEIVLFWLFVNKAIPKLMTFEGRNFDIISGLTAPIIYYFGFVKTYISPKLILLWNIVCLALLINIVVNAILSAPFKFQIFAFDQPNIAVLHFPFIWLPCCIVPLVLLSHLVTIRQLLIKERSK